MGAVSASRIYIACCVKLYAVRDARVDVREHPPVLECFRLLVDVKLITGTSTSVRAEKPRAKCSHRRWFGLVVAEEASVCTRVSAAHTVSFAIETREGLREFRTRMPSFRSD